MTSVSESILIFCACGNAPEYISSPLLILPLSILPFRITSLTEGNALFRTSSIVPVRVSFKADVNASLLTVPTWLCISTSVHSSASSKAFCPIASKSDAITIFFT